MDSSPILFFVFIVIFLVILIVIWFSNEIIVLVSYFSLFANRIVYFIAVALTAAVFINERKSGLLDRSIVAGKDNISFHLCHSFPFSFSLYLFERFPFEL